MWTILTLLFGGLVRAVLADAETIPDGFVKIEPQNYTAYFEGSDSCAVNIGHPYHIMDREVTVDEYQKYDSRSSSYRCNRPDCPVTNVSWLDVQGYIEFLNPIYALDDRYQLRLCSESEWEYAALIHPGTGNLREYAWYSLDIDTGLKPVKNKKPNTLGLYDMLGNAMEWTDDWYHPRREICGDDSSELVPDAWERKLLKGGSYISFEHFVAPEARCAYRMNHRNVDVGFRLCIAKKRGKFAEPLN